MRKRFLTSESHPCVRARVAFLRLACAIACAWALAGGVAGAVPGMALAAEDAAADAALNPGGVTLTDQGFASRSTNAAGELHPHPFVEFPLVQLVFSKNVSYARDGMDDAFIAQNMDKVSLRRADGKPVEADWRVVSTGTFEERACLGVVVDGWLAPLTDYEVVVAPGVLAANGTDVSDEEYVVAFRTSEECADGLTVYEKAVIVFGTAAVMAGVAAGVVRMRREKRL